MVVLHGSVHLLLGRLLSARLRLFGLGSVSTFSDRLVKLGRSDALSDFLNLVNLRILILVFENIVCHGVSLVGTRIVVELGLLSLVVGLPSVSFRTVNHVFVCSTATSASVRGLVGPALTSFSTFFFFSFLSLLNGGLDSGVFLGVFRLISLRFLGLLSVIDLFRFVLSFGLFVGRRVHSPARSRPFNLLIISSRILGLLVRSAFIGVFLSASRLCFLFCFLLGSQTFGFLLSSLLGFQSISFQFFLALLLTDSFLFLLSFGLFGFTGCLSLFELDLTLLLNALVVSDLLLTALGSFLFLLRHRGLPFEFLQALVLLARRVLAELPVDGLFVEFALVADSRDVILVELHAEVFARVRLLLLQDDHLLVRQRQLNDTIVVAVDVVVDLGLLPPVIIALVATTARVRPVRVVAALAPLRVVVRAIAASATSTTTVLAAAPVRAVLAASAVVAATWTLSVHGIRGGSLIALLLLALLVTIDCRHERLSEVVRVVGVRLRRGCTSAAVVVASIIGRTATTARVVRTIATTAVGPATISALRTVVGVASLTVILVLLLPVVLTFWLLICSA